MAARRLPVIQEPSGPDADAAARPAWHWVLIGSGLLVTLWTPAVGLALIVARKIAVTRAPGAQPGLLPTLVAVSWALSALAAGYLVACFGRRTRARHAVLAGVAAATEIWLLALMGGAFRANLLAITAFLTLCLLSSGFCALGAWLARRKKSAP